MERPKLEPKGLDAKLVKEFNEWFESLGPKYDKEDDPDDWSIQVRWWAWEAWRFARRIAPESEY